MSLSTSALPPFHNQQDGTAIIEAMNVKTPTSKRDRIIPLTLMLRNLSGGLLHHRYSRSVRNERETRQPTIMREKTSITKAT